MNEHTHCDDLLSSLSEFIDGSLPAEFCNELERHLRDCQKCRIVVNTLKKTVELYQDTAGDAPMPEAVRQRLFACLDLNDFISKEK